MIGKLGHQPPFLVCELRAEGAPARRLLALAHGGKLQGENAAELIFRVRMGGSECVGAIDQHVPKLEGLSGKTQNSVAPLNHVLPHVVECVRQQRQGAHILDRVLGRSAGNDVREPLGLEPCREQFGRPAHDLAQLCLA